MQFDRIILRRAALAFLVIVFAAANIAWGQIANPVTDVVMDLNHIHKWDDSNGDTWDPFWADDGNLYAFNCDGRGFGTLKKNLAFNELIGDEPDQLAGKLINSMDAYGKSGQRGADGATWKALGQECIDSVFYVFISRHVYGKESGDRLMRQTAGNASLIKSTDRGLTWTRDESENYAKPMWPGRRFGASYFVHYGENGGQIKYDAADRYVYAVSNNGFWNDGDDFILGRVERGKLAELNAGDWTYYTGGDGADAENWSSEMRRATAIMSLPAKCGTTSPCFVPALNVYLMVSWYIPTPLKKWFRPDEIRYDFYQAKHVWGPWSFIRSYSDRFISAGHMYGPTLCAKFQSVVDGDVRLSLFTAGYPPPDKPSGLYKMWEIPLVVKTKPVVPSVLVKDDDAGIKYVGDWAVSATTEPSGYEGDGKYAKTPGDSAEFSFDGTGIEYLAEKADGYGKMDVFLDGKARGTVDLAIANFPKLIGVSVFEAQGLAMGEHTIRLVNAGTRDVVVDGFRVFGGK